MHSINIHSFDCSSPFSPFVLKKKCEQRKNKILNNNSAIFEMLQFKVWSESSQILILMEIVVMLQWPLWGQDIRCVLYIQKR